MTRTPNTAPANGQADAPLPPAIAAPSPLLVGHAEAARLCALGLSTWHRLLAAGRIGPAPVRLGGRVLFNVEELRVWCRAACPDRVEWQARRAAAANREGQRRG